MRVLEEPFTTRESILAVLRPGLLPTESPFRTLRKSRHVSPGLRVDVRSRGGQLLGHAQLYSSLNADAARAARLGETQIATALASRAAQLESSPDATLLRAAVQAVGAGMSADPMHSDAPLALRQYLQLRKRTLLTNVSDTALARDWLVQSAAWFDAGERSEIEAAVVALAKGASEARADVCQECSTQESVFYGIVRRMDGTAAEIVGEDDARLVPRRDLERQGLAVLGQAVALLCEAFPAGGTLVLPHPAIALDAPLSPVAPSPWEVDDEGSVSALLIEPADREWIDRGLARERAAVPIAPIPRQ
jgi:hypothetical protein